MQPQTPSVVKPALIAAVIFGVASAIPFLNFLNCLCCALIIACGITAAYLQSQACERAGAPFAAGEGALVGLVSGLFYGLIGGTLGGLMSMVTGMGDMTEMIEQMRSAGVEMDPATLDQATRFMESAGPALLLLMSIFFSLLLGAIFATLGGLIGGALFKKEGPPPAMPSAPTPPPMSQSGSAPPPPPPTA